jgi:high affinity Mn2+ porin
MGRWGRFVDGMRGGAAVCLGATLLGPGAAIAADLPSAPLFTWAGFYVGANLGVGLAPHSNVHYDAIGLRSGSDLDPPIGPLQPGATLGGQIGYNWQFGRVVLGVETDFDYLGDRPARTGTYGAPPGLAATGVTSYTLGGGGSAFFGSLRGRVGYAFDRLLVYGTGGVAYGGSSDPAFIVLHPSGPGSVPFTANYSRSSQMKYVVGGGLEYALAPNWTMRGEYLFASLSRNEQDFAGAAGTGYVLRLANTNHLLRFGLNYKFGAPDSSAPVVAKADDTKDGAAETYSVHAQLTEIPQYHPGYHAPYSGPNSMSPNAELKETFSATAFLGLGLWKGAALYVNPEIDQGFGDSNSFGVAGFPNNEAFKVGRSAPYIRAQRYFVRQVVGLGGGTESMEAGQNQLAGPVDKNRLTFTVGKYSVVDIFDDNKYAHDSRNGFLNWTINTMGAFDYAADSWGYTNGATVEWRQDWWTLRAGTFQLSQTPNSETIEPVPLRQFQQVVEAEERHVIAGQPGKLKALAFLSDGYMGNFNQALAAAAGTGLPPDVTTTRARRVKFGGGLNLEQQLLPSLGLFARISAASGQYETFDFTEVERSVAAGVVVTGDLWGRANDQVGLGGVVNGISNAHAAYLAAGGTGIILGDGTLSYAGERVLETYYKFAIADGVNLTANYQFVTDPGYNSARGPVSFFALRFHAEF